MTDLGISAGQPAEAARHRGAWHVVLTAAVNVAAGIPIAGSLGLVVGHGYVSDPGVVVGIGWALVASISLALVLLNVLLQRVITGWRPLLGLLAAAAAATPSVLTLASSGG